MKEFFLLDSRGSPYHNEIMAEDIKQYKIYIASPEDVREEREIIREICEKLNDNPLVEKEYVRLKVVGWEDAFPSAGDPRKIIGCLQKNCDLFICLFHRTFESEQHETLGLFLNAYESWKEMRKPHIMLYFKDANVKSRKEITEELNKVWDFKEKVVEERLVLYKEYKDTPDFTTRFENHLQKWIAEYNPDEKIPETTIKTPQAIIPPLYKKYITEHCKHMDIDTLRENTKALHLGLPEVYIPLYATFHKNPRESREHRQGVLSIEIVSFDIDIESFMEKQDALIIKGEAGSGKTTILRHLACTIINEKNPYGLNRFLPILIFLKDLKKILDRENPGSPSVNGAEMLLTRYCEEKRTGLTPEVIKAFCREERALFLMDGLDELSPEYRDFVAGSFADFLLPYDGVKILWSGRPHGITGVVTQRFYKKDGNETIYPILPFIDDQVKEFVTKWWHEVNATDPEYVKIKSPDGLMADLGSNPALEELKRNPLMLTAICFLYLDDKCLPDQRVELYDRFTRRMLVNRFKSREYQELFKYFSRLAYKMFLKGDRGIGRIEAAKLLKEFRDRENSSLPKEDTPDLYFDRVEAASGLMINEAGEYRFSHLSIQEFLTASHIMDEEYNQKIYDNLHDPRYRNVILLYLGLLSVKNNSGMANRIIQDILRKEKDHNKWLIGAQALVDIHTANCKPESKQLAVSKMGEIIEAGAAPSILAEAGELLGRLGDVRDLKEFVKVKGGTYDLEELGKETPEHFEIGRYPVINRWYEEFMDAGGYEKEQYWTNGGAEWLTENKGIKAPMYWHDRRFNLPNAPVVGVTWYEAVAFTNWLTETRKDGYTYRLPNEKEWQLAAAGKEQNKYPWGTEWEDGRCNSYDTGINKTSAVGIFVSGNTLENDKVREKSIADLAGNVWEWTGNLYAKGSEFYVLRGGSWLDVRDYSRCAYRNYVSPYYRSFNIGFRCARTVKGGS